MANILVIIPTYNEKENIQSIIKSVLKHDSFHALVIDDGSPDGTPEVVRQMMPAEKKVFLIERAGKLGLGTAYVEGFKWGLERGYDYFIEMDADGSHDPEALPSFILEIEKGCDLVIGSRYLNKAISVVGWDFHRLMLSKFGNYYASWVLGLRLTDLTSGFRCYSRRSLESFDLAAVHSAGYGFQIEMAYRVAVAGGRACEIPIIFYERTTGVSKMSKSIVREAIALPWMLRLTRLFGKGKTAAVTDIKYNVRTVIGFFTVMAGVTGGLWLGWWLSTEGDIVEIIHRAKMGLPDWGWTALKIGLSAVSAGLFISLLLALAIAIFAVGGRK